MPREKWNWPFVQTSDSDGIPVKKGEVSEAQRLFGYLIVFQFDHLPREIGGKVVESCLLVHGMPRPITLQLD
jgi:hypothetical protein